MSQKSFVLGMVLVIAIAFGVYHIANPTETRATYTNKEYGYSFEYPAAWELRSGSDFAQFTLINGNGFNDLSFDVHDQEVKLDAAADCVTPKIEPGLIASGQYVYWLTQTCILPEERDIYGTGYSIAGNIMLDNGKVLHVQGQSTERPENITSELHAVLKSIRVLTPSQ